MKKLVLSSAVGGVVYAVLILIFGLVSQVVEYRLTSLVCGGVLVAFIGVMFGVIRKSCNFKRNSGKDFLSLVIVVGVALAILMVSERLWTPLATNHISIGWLILGCVLYVVVDVTVKVLRKKDEADPDSLK